MTDRPPYLRWRHPPGCPDSDWCSGNSTCHWDCQGDPDAGIEPAPAIERPNPETITREIGE